MRRGLFYYLLMSVIIVVMDSSLIYVVLLVLGLCFGSFGGAMVWRLRARQLIEDKADGEPVDAKELQRLKVIGSAKTRSDRSMCLNCQHILAWYDMIPLLSWMSLGGKCRYCRSPIGVMEPLMELGLASFFVASYALWPYALTTGIDMGIFIMWLVSGVGLVVLFAYDVKWFLLPNRVIFPLIAIAFVSAGLTVYGSDEALMQLISIFISVLILSGLYWLIWTVSRGKWVGFGDVKLGLALALLLADWRLAFLTLFLANLVGCFVVIPGLISGKLSRKTHVPFGPLLIVGFVIAGLVGQGIISWYISGIGLGTFGMMFML